MLQSLKVWKGDLTNHILEIRSLWQDSFELHYTLKVQDQTKMAGLLIHVEEDCLLPLCRVLVGLDFLGAYKYIHLFFSTIPYDLAGWGHVPWVPESPLPPWALSVPICFDWPMPGRQKAKACSVAISLPDGWFSHVFRRKSMGWSWEAVAFRDHWLMQLFFVQHEIYCIPSNACRVTKTTFE